MNAYKSWVRANYSWLSSVENAASALTWLLPERLADSELAPETLSTVLGMFSVLNEHIVASAPNITGQSQRRRGGLVTEGGSFSPSASPAPWMPCSERAENMGLEHHKERGSQSAGTMTPWPLMLSLTKEMEVLLELVAEQFGGKDGKWSIVAMVEAIKALTRLKVLRSSGGRMLISGGTETNEPGDREVPAGVGSETRSGNSEIVPNAPSVVPIQRGRHLDWSPQRGRGEGGGSRVRDNSAWKGGLRGPGGGEYYNDRLGPASQMELEDEQRVMAFKAFNRFRTKSLHGVATPSWALQESDNVMGEWEREEGELEVASYEKFKDDGMTFDPQHWTGSDCQMVASIESLEEAWTDSSKSCYPPPSLRYPCGRDTCTDGMISEERSSSNAAMVGSFSSSATPVPLSRNPAQLSPCSPLTWRVRPSDSPSSTVEGSSSCAREDLGGQEDDSAACQLIDIFQKNDPIGSFFSALSMRRVLELFIPNYADFPPEAKVGRQVLLAGEVLFILRPLLYVLAIRRYGAKAWRPWCLSLSVDLFSLALQSYGEALCVGTENNGGGANGRALGTWSGGSGDGGAGHVRGGLRSQREREELIRRRVQLLFYLIRSPFFDVVTRRPIGVAERMLKPVPLLGTLANKAVEILMGIQGYYFYTAAS